MEKEQKFDIGKEAVKFITKYEKKQNREVIDVQHNRKHKGYDILSISKDGKKRKIEAKGTKWEFGIPDLHDTEVDNGVLVADFLYVVSFFDKKPKLYIIPREALSPEDFRPVKSYRVCSNFRTQRMKNYRII